MKIFLIGQKGIPGTSGGVEKHVEELSIRLVNAGHEVYAYTRPEYTDKKLKEYKGVKLISLPSINNKNLNAIVHTFISCLDLIFRRKPDIIHFHSIGPSSLIWLIRIFKPKTPVIATFHTQCYYHAKWGSFAKLYLKFSEFVLCKFANKIIVVSKTLQNYVKNKYKKESCYIPNGVSMGEDEDADEIKKWGLDNGNYIVSISRLVRHKGIHYLINAYNNINTDKKLVIVGDGSYTDNYTKELKQLAGDNKNIIFTGNQSGKILKELFSNAFLFVQPSETEGLSIALLEAMSFGTPVLISDIPENKEVVEGNGFIFNNKDENDLAKKMRYILDNPDIAKEKAILSKQRAEDFYSWDNIVKEIIEKYKEMTNKK